MRLSFMSGTRSLPSEPLRRIGISRLRTRGTDIGIARREHVVSIARLAGVGVLAMVVMVVRRLNVARLMGARHSGIDALGKRHIELRV